MAATKTLSVSKVNAHIKGLLEWDVDLKNITVLGEVSNYRPHPSGHVYLTVKDNKSQLKVVMWKSATYTGIRHRLADGQQVEITGDITLYEAGGYYQLQATSIRLAGVGDLYEQFEKLKQRLNAEGLFSREHKLPIPEHPKTIGIVTASQGDALRDICSTLKRRNPYVQPILCPARVQGEGAAQSVCRAIRRLEQRGVDLILVCRGGGSIEDLWAFNEEIVARCVYDCTVPIISGVGHEPDVTIIDYVSDLRAPTPTGAAEMAVKPVEDLDAMLVDRHAELVSAMMNLIENRRDRVETLGKLLNAQSPRSRLTRRKEQVSEREERLTRAIHRVMDTYRLRLQREAARLDGLSPVKKISKGFGYLTGPTGRALESVTEVGPGEPVNIYVSDGKIHATVDSVERAEDTTNE